MNDTYLFVLGKNTDLSRAEAQIFSQEILFDRSKGLYLGQNLIFQNPRNIPKSPEQLFLDRLGGTIRIAKVLGEFQSKSEIVQKIKEIFQKKNKEGTQYIGVSVFGTGNVFQREFQLETENVLQKSLKKKIRFENQAFENLTSGQIFDRKLLKKGYEFIIWKNKDSFLLCQTSANQNIRNYTIRDRAKSFRDSHMGMMPPKLAQILINLSLGTSQKKFNTIVVDPFCGSGTTNGEAAIMGYPGIGSDKNPDFLSGAKGNFEFLSQKFRFDKNSCDFFVRSAQKFPWKDIQSDFVVATEGWLGENFHTLPSQKQITMNEKLVLEMWDDFFKNLSQNLKTKKIRISLCLPAWKTRSGYYSISEKLFAKTKKLGYSPVVLFGPQKTCQYKREGANVAREICVLEKT